MYICCVCGYNGLDEPPYTFNCPSYEICPCCDIEFGFNDRFLFVKEECWIELRKMWIDNGMKWLHNNEYIQQPIDYDPVKQLLNIGIIYNNKN